jgi:hypothetical protein
MLMLLRVHRQHPTRKLYMLAGLEPSVALTGGPWYTDNELDTEFIDTLIKACYKFICDMVCGSLFLPWLCGVGVSVRSLIQTSIYFPVPCSPSRTASHRNPHSSRPHLDRTLATNATSPSPSGHEHSPIHSFSPFSRPVYLSNSGERVNDLNRVFPRDEIKALPRPKTCFTRSHTPHDIPLRRRSKRRSNRRG